MPDSIDQITSDHGWSSGKHDDDLKIVINKLKEYSNDASISLFIDSIEGVEYAYEMGATLIEIHTGEFSKAIETKNIKAVDDIVEIVKIASKLNLSVNAGHDLNLKNLSYLVDIGNINEVSIGHAIIVDSLHYGFEETIMKYLDIIRK